MVRLITKLLPAAAWVLVNFATRTSLKHFQIQPFSQNAWICHRQGITRLENLEGSSSHAEEDRDEPSQVCNGETNFNYSSKFKYNKL